MKIRIATRKSELALWQANHVADRLRALEGVDAVTLVPLSTRGDEILDRSLQKIGGKGLFIKELEIAMQSGDADIAVHSMKDVPADMPEGFTIAAVLERANPHDAFLSADGTRFESLAQGARIGSSSLRRQAQLRAMRPDVEVVPLRGNVNTRLAKLDSGDYDAIILAAAGLERLGLADRITAEFRPEQMLPAAAQGVVGIECLAAQTELKALLERLEDGVAKATSTAERAVAATLDANCQSPVASFARIDQGVLELEALVASPDGTRIIRDRAGGDPGDAAEIGAGLANSMLARGAGELLQSIAS